jgi:hypothetical protein
LEALRDLAKHDAIATPHRCSGLRHRGAVDLQLARQYAAADIEQHPLSARGGGIT